jgi:hypothetical protein
MVGLSPRADACGLEHSFRGGSLISHPGSLRVAVAVAEARNQGLLPTESPDNLPNDVRLRRMLADLGLLRSQLAQDVADDSNRRSARFSLMLIGPALWSEYLVSSSGVLARYHTTGPRTGQVVVLTHHAVLKALLQGSLSLAQATDLGLIAFSGAESEPVQQLFEVGFGTNS